MEERKSNQWSADKCGWWELCVCACERESVSLVGCGLGGVGGSRRERQRKVTQIERRCLIWHGVPQRHLISFNSCRR